MPKATGPGPLDVISLFDRAAAERPDALAVTGEQGGLTYAELAHKVDHLASHLRNLGVDKGTMVGLCLGRSQEMVVAVLAILRTGAAYVPFDPAYPLERIALMLEDSKPVLVVTDGSNKHLFKSANVLLIEDVHTGKEPLEGMPPPTTVSAEDLCYVLFTSGSTGRPKGVAMPHGALANLINWQLRTSILKAGSKTLQFAPISFDVSFQELFTTFAQGGTLVLITDEDRLNSTQLLSKVIAEDINRIIVPFVALQYLAEAVQRTGEVPKSLREVFTSGEQLRITPAISALFKQLPGCRFCNQYGPTEGHVVSELELKGDPGLWPELPTIGTAIDNVKLLVLDEKMKPVPQGTEGELYLGGACVAQGYIGRDDLTAERFLTDPFTPGGRLYKTGDRAVEMQDGNIDYRGRMDGQVKVRGYRIELGEVEAALEKHADIQQAVASVREDIPGLKRLVAYYAGGKSISTNELRTHLGALLPDYMVPAAFVPVRNSPARPVARSTARRCLLPM
jgi:amino acid adenylation domain-containing protein